MDFLVLLIIGLGIILITLFMRIEKRWGLIYFFTIYLIFLLYTGYIEWESYYFYHKTFYYSAGFMGLNKNDLFLGIFYLEFFFIFYCLFYFLIFPFQDKQMSLQKKGYFLLRDFIILFSVFLFFWGYNDVAGKYQYYYDWYKNPDNFGGEEFVCMDKSARLLLERNYRHAVIVNPYNNFFEFYKNYGKKKNFGEVLTNKLPEKLVIKNYLTTCINNKGENYFQKYIDTHGIEPYYKSPDNHSHLYYEYIISKKEIGDILEKIDGRNNYVDNLLDYKYSEFELDISFDELNNDYEKVKEIDKEIDILRENKFSEYSHWIKQDLYTQIPYFDAGWPCGKRGEECVGGKFGISEKILKQAINEKWSRFYKDLEGNMYITTLQSLYKNNEQIYKNDLMHAETSGPIKNLGKINNQLTFEYQYLDLENNIKYQENYCDNVLKYGKGRYKECELIYVPEERKNIPQCKNNKELLGFTQYTKCNEYKYDYDYMKTNIFFNNTDINKIYHLEGSRNIFSYNNKIGFIAHKNGKIFIIYDGKQISENFTYIKTQTCCASFRYKFNLYNNGVLEYIFVREKKIFVGFIQLK